MTWHGIRASIGVSLSFALLSALMALPSHATQMVWAGRGAGGLIQKLDLSGNNLNDDILLGDPLAVSALAIVGDEVWAGRGAGGLIYRLDLSGNNLNDDILLGDPLAVSALAIVGDEVWVGRGAGGLIQRLDLSGNNLNDDILLGDPLAVSALAIIPEPSAALLIGLGLVGLGARRKMQDASSGWLQRSGATSNSTRIPAGSISPTTKCRNFG